MHTYLILQDPGHNRVYYIESQKLCLAELELAGIKMEAEISNAKWIQVAGIHYLSFESNVALSSEDVDLLSRMSFIFALFELSSSEESPVLIPVAKSEFAYLDSKISSLLKYQGKTNELFTRMMINVAMLSSTLNYSDAIKLFDPVAGKGTTLFEATIHGFDAFGVEQEEKSVHEASVFFKKYLEREKIKHQTAKLKFAGKIKASGVFKQEFEYAKTKEEFKEKAKKMIMVSGDTAEASTYFKKNGFHLLVGDLPYGVAHGSKAEASKSRNPLELLDKCLPEWNKLLKKGAVAVLAYNKFVTPAGRLHEVFGNHGFEVLKEGAYRNFEHRVDQAIKRDIVVARKM